MSNVWSSQDYEKFVCPDGSQALSVRTPTAVTRLSLSARSQELIVTTEPILAGIKEKKSFFESWERKMSELSHEVRNGHRILTIPDFKCNFARREANQAEGQQHQTSRVLSLRRVMCNVIWGHDYNQTLTITTYEGSLDEKVTTKADKDLTLYEILERWRKLILLIIQAPWLKLLSEMMNDPFFSNSERLGALQSLIF